MEVCLGMLYGLMMGIFRPGHMGLKLDKVFHKLAGMTRLPSQSTISRFLSKITVHKAQHVAEINFKLLRQIRKGFRELEAITLDLDSHVISGFGKQHRATSQIPSSGVLLEAFLDSCEAGREWPQDQAQTGGLVATQGGILQSPHCPHLILPCREDSRRSAWLREDGSAPFFD